MSNRKDKVPTSAKVEFNLAMHDFMQLLRAHQITVDQIKEATRGKKDVKEGVQEKGYQGSDEAKQEETWAAT